jgi:1-acylglycerone phosphate reductase
MQSLSASAPGVAGSGGLDILINNAGGHYTAPISDASLDSARALFELNVWAQLAVTQAFLPLLLKSASFSTTHSSNGVAVPIVVNHTSVGSVSPLPFQSIYSASKAAFARLSDGMRLELAAFGIRVVELKTAMVQSNFIHNSQTSNVEGNQLRLPQGSLFEPARDIVERAMRQEQFEGRGMTAEKWAEGMLKDLLKSKPPPIVWKGDSALWGRLMAIMPVGVIDGMLKRMMKLDIVERIIRESRKKELPGVV